MKYFETSCRRNLAVTFFLHDNVLVKKITKKCVGIVLRFNEGLQTHTCSFTRTYKHAKQYMNMNSLNVLTILLNLRKRERENLAFVFQTK